MSTRTRHIREFVETLTGPTVYVVYFGLTYLATTLPCTLAEGASAVLEDGGATAFTVTLILTLAALVAIGIASLDALRRLASSNRNAEDDQDVFMALLTLALAALSALAVLWTGTSALLVPACA